MEWVIGICVTVLVFQIITMVEIGCIAENVEKLMAEKELIAFIENLKEKNNEL